MSDNTSNSIQGNKPFLDQLHEYEVDQRIAQGCEIAKSVHERIMNRLSDKADSNEIDNSPFSIAKEYSRAMRRQNFIIRGKNIYPKRWSDHLASQDHLTHDEKIRLGIDVYRAALKSIVDPPPFRLRRKDTPSSFWPIVDLVAQILSKEKLDGWMSKEKFSYWTHDLRNAVTPLTMIDELPPLSDSKGELTVQTGKEIDRFITLLRSMNATGLPQFETILSNSLLPLLERLMVALSDTPQTLDELPGLKGDVLTSIQSFHQIASDFRKEYLGYQKHFEVISPSRHLEQIACFVSTFSSRIQYSHRSDCPADMAVWANRSDFDRILKNLIKNSCEAVLENNNRPMIIETLVKPSSLARFQNTPEPTHASSAIRFVEIQINDNGCGIPPERIPTLFLNSKTTKANGHGIGLHSVHSIVTSYGGTLKVESDPSKPGTRFSIHFPVFPKH
jgi:signal transduction histidine kinase